MFSVECEAFRLIKLRWAFEEFIVRCSEELELLDHVLGCPSCQEWLSNTPSFRGVELASWARERRARLLALRRSASLELGSLSEWFKAD